MSAWKHLWLAASLLTVAGLSPITPGSAANGGAGSSQGQPFALGVEYMSPDLAETYAKTGVQWTKAMGAGFAWDDVDPKPHRLLLTPTERDVPMPPVRTLTPAQGRLTIKLGATLVFLEACDGGSKEATK